MVHVTPIPALGDNYIWLLRQDDSSRAVVVDPGDAAPVIEHIEREGLTLENILITHHHHDHTGGLQELVERYRPHVFGPDNPAIGNIDTPLSDGDQCSILDRHFEVIATPGHTLDHISFFAAGIPALLFCGDTLFLAGCGRLFEGSAEQMHTSLSRLAELPDDTLIFAAHEYTLANLRFAKAADPDNPHVDSAIAQCQTLRDQGRPTLPTQLDSERKINPFLRSAEPAVQASAALHGATDSPLATFATLRAWKDRF